MTSVFQDSTLELHFQTETFTYETWDLNMELVWDSLSQLYYLLSTSFVYISLLDRQYLLLQQSSDSETEIYSIKKEECPHQELTLQGITIQSIMCPQTSNKFLKKLDNEEELSLRVNKVKDILYPSQQAIPEVNESSNEDFEEEGQSNINHTLGDNSMIGLNLPNSKSYSLVFYPYLIYDSFGIWKKGKNDQPKPL